MAIDYRYDPPLEGTHEVIVSFYWHDDLVLKCPVYTVFNPGPYDAELTEQHVRNFAAVVQARLEEADRPLVDFNGEEVDV